MSKKEILVVVLVLLVLGGVTAGGIATWDHYNKWKISKDGLQAANGTPANDNIALNSAPSLTDSNGSGIKVDTSLNASNPAQLGSGIATNTGNTSQSTNSSPSSTSSSQAPGPETFGQYNQYKDAKNALFGDIQVGTGNEVVANKKVAIYYKGWLTDGTLFDQSRADSTGKLQPFIFTVGSHEVIAGMEQDIVGMKVGGTRRMIVPPAVGYGAQQQGNIPPNSVLVFDVQLIAIQ